MKCGYPLPCPHHTYELADGKVGVPFHADPSPMLLDHLREIGIAVGSDAPPKKRRKRGVRRGR